MADEDEQTAALPAEKPPMPGTLRPLAQQAIARHQKRLCAPGVVSKPDQGYFENLTCPYRDEDEDMWLALLLECFGTRVVEVGNAFMCQLYALCPEVFYEGESRPRACEETMRQALEIVFSLKPRNAAEAAAAAQMVALHFAAMKVGQNIGQRGYADPRTIASLAMVAKTYGSLLGALNDRKGRRSTRQTIKVEKRITYAPQYTDNRRVYLGEGGGESGSRAHAASQPRARAKPPVPGENESGRDLSVIPGEGPEPLSITRRS